MSYDLLYLLEYIEIWKRNCAYYVLYIKQNFINEEAVAVSIYYTV